MREKLAYDHVGVTACLYENDADGVESRIAKARRAFNAITGLGIRRNGLSIATCNTIFWAIVSPITLFWSEMWVLGDKSIKLVEDFQNYAGKRIQRLSGETPNACAFYGLGWIRLERMIEIKKMIFIRSLMALCTTEPSRLVFCERAAVYMGEIHKGRENLHGSVVFDLLNVASTFGMLMEVINMIRNGHMWSKVEWRRMVWERAWELDACFWRIQMRCHKSLNLLSSISENSSYLIWWQIADDNHQLMNKCETVVKLLSHASILKDDDVRLKGSPMFSKFCEDCDLGVVDDVRHLVLQCPKRQVKRTEMMNAIENIPDGCDPVLLNSRYDLVIALLGGLGNTFTYEQKSMILAISADYISKVYYEKVKDGIG